MRILDGGWQIVTGKVVKYFCQQNLDLCDDIDVGRSRSSQEERGRLTEEIEERCDEAVEDEVDLGVERVGSNLGTPVTKDGMGGFEYAKVDIVLCGGEGKDELLL